MPDMPCHDAAAAIAVSCSRCSPAHPCLTCRALADGRAAEIAVAETICHRVRVPLPALADAGRHEPGPGWREGCAVTGALGILLAGRIGGQGGTMLIAGVTVGQPGASQLAELIHQFTASGGPSADAGDVLLLCDGCYQAAAGLAAECEDGCMQDLDHTGLCLRPSDHHCQWCGGCDRLHEMVRDEVDDRLPTVGEEDEGLWYLRWPRDRRGPYPAAQAAWDAWHDDGDAAVLEPRGNLAPAVTTEAMNEVARAIAAEIRSRRAGLAQDRHAEGFPASRRNPPESRRAQELACINGMVIALSFVIGTPYDMQAAEDLIRQAGTPDGRTATGGRHYDALVSGHAAGGEPATVSSAAFRAEAKRLAGEIGDLARAWAAATKVDANLGDDLERAGQSLVRLASMLATAIAQQNPRQAAQLHDLAAELAEAVDDYADLEEHDIGASIDIFGRLGPA